MDRRKLRIRPIDTRILYPVYHDSLVGSYVSYSEDPKPKKCINGYERKWKNSHKPNDLNTV